MRKWWNHFLGWTDGVRVSLGAAAHLNQDHGEKGIWLLFRKREIDALEKSAREGERLRGSEKIKFQSKPYTHNTMCECDQARIKASYLS